MEMKTFEFHRNGTHCWKRFVLERFQSRCRGQHFNFQPSGSQTENIFAKVQTLRIRQSPRTQKNSFANTSTRPDELDSFEFKYFL